MSSSAQRKLYDEMYEEQPADAEAMAAGVEGAANLRRMAAQRLAAHRNRRAAIEPRMMAAANEAPVISEAARRVRDAVAARYRESPSYREFLATQPASEQVLPLGDEPVGVAEAEAGPTGELADMVKTVATDTSWDWVDERAPMGMGSEVALPSFALGEWQVRPYEELPAPQPLPERSCLEPVVHAEELEGLEEEIEFRLAPEFDEHLIEPVPIQANIIEFPRQLVAPRKARPRLAEGPLRADVEIQHEAAVEPVPEFQMRIFEVEEPLSAQIPLPVTASVTAEPPPPEWQDLVLDAPVKEHAAEATVQDEMPAVAASVQEQVTLPVAPFELRLMSAAVDAVYIGMSFVAFVTVAVWMSGHAAESALRETSIPWLAAFSVVAVTLLAVVYQAIFFMLGETTPGMSYAGLVFRSMANKEPSRRALRRRVGANVLAAAPLGLGMLWSVFDRQRLGWNDRMSGVYLREF